MSIIEQTDPTLNQEPDTAPTEGTTVIEPPLENADHGAPPAPRVRPPYEHKPGIEAEVWDTRIVKDGIRLDSPKVLLNVASVYE